MNLDIKLLGFTDIMSDSEERTEETPGHSEPKNATQEQSSAEEKICYSPIRQDQDSPTHPGGSTQAEETTRLPKGKDTGDREGGQRRELDEVYPSEH